MLRFLFWQRSEHHSWPQPSKPFRQAVALIGIKLERYRMTLQSLSGEGVKPGTAYRLRSGEVVYVPEADPGYPTQKEGTADPAVTLR